MKSCGISGLLKSKIFLYVTIVGIQLESETSAKTTSFLTLDDFCRKFAIKTNFLIYYGLCNAIPQNWIRLLKEFNSSVHTGSKYADNIFLNKLSCKSASRFTVGRKFVPTTAEQRMLQANLCRKTIDTNYIIPFKVTKYIRCAIFQFKIIHHILPSNATLSKIKLLNMTSVMSSSFNKRVLSCHQVIYLLCFKGRRTVLFRSLPRFP